ncbi:Cyclic nucleotide-binding protein [Gammaproteobacteria bacterium]
MRKVLLILGQLSDTDVSWLARNGRTQKFAAGMELIRQGTRIDTIYIILEGVMSVTIASGIKLAEVGSGDILGEMSLVDSAPTVASVRVEQDSTVLAISKSVLQQKLTGDFAFASRFYRALAMFLADRMRNTIRTMGYSTEQELASDQPSPDELDPNVLDNVFLGGSRFERMLKQLAGG